MKLQVNQKAAKKTSTGRDKVAGGSERPPG